MQPRSDPHAQLERTLGSLREALLAERNERGHWEGYLSSSALSSATASAALWLSAAAAGPHAAEDRARARAGCDWLAAHQNADGGWGDTSQSPSNVSTTLLAWMALGLAPEGCYGSTIGLAEAWLQADLGGLDGASIARRLEAVYGADRTFAVPILMACALGGRLGPEAEAWALVPSLPFELAALPQGLFRFLGLPVVSYAMPALIAIGQVIHHKRPSKNPLARLLRQATRGRTQKVLAAIQPENGGYLEATPLTSFVALSLMGCGLHAHPVTQKCLAFLRASLRANGSWPIDTNLATWVSTLSLGALEGAGGVAQSLGSAGSEAMQRWLLEQQLARVHPYTGAAPGGWAWTDLPGGVPDADDTAGALLALHALSGGSPPQPELLGAAAAGCTWLADLANRDGGLPTFCRGFGSLPFDQSCPDLSAHALRAWQAWLPHLEAPLAKRLEVASRRVRMHLLGTQEADGSWIPLWFGNQAEPNQRNPLYGTTRVLRTACIPGDPAWRAGLLRALEWLLAAQAGDGGFGGARGIRASIEETGMALEALACAAEAQLGERAALRDCMGRAAHWLMTRCEPAQDLEPAPIGLYFAQLWYSERLYPLVHALSGLGRAAPWLRPTQAGPLEPGSLD